jgi:uncharacterized membrane protein/uncharacterized RDD family membrane protein YckC
VVDVLQLTTDIVENSVYLATPPLLWMLVFLCAWGEEAEARESGFGRRTFWLLLPGALLGEFANLPFFGWSHDVLAVNLGGGLIPLVLSVVLLGRILGDRARLLAEFFTAFALLSGASLAVVLVIPDGPGLDAALVVIALASFLILWSLARSQSDPVARRTGMNASYLLGLSSLALVPTFASTTTVPGLGIESAFPWYLLPPILVGALAVLWAGPLFGVSRRAALGLGYASATFGVLVGADLLRQPPLYAGSAAGLYAIGGAGTSDLLYLSGLLALGASLVVLALVGPGRADAPVVRPDPASVAGLTSGGLLRRSLVSAVEGRVADSVRDSHAAVEAALGQAYALAATAQDGTAARDPVAVLGVPTWVEADRSNLAALSQSPRLDPLDATRAWLTARWIVRFARLASRRFFGSFGVRGAAFLLDLGLVTAPAIVLWYYLVATTSGNVNDLLGSVPINAALFGYTSFALLYFVLGEGFLGTTVGKWAFGLTVRARGLAWPGPRAVLLRNLPKLATLTLLGVLGIFVIILVQRGATIAISLPGGFDLAVNAGYPIVGLLMVGLAVLGALSGVAIHFTPERQRFGDLLADTWVVVAPPTGAMARRVRTARAVPSSEAGS